MRIHCTALLAKPSVYWRLLHGGKPFRSIYTLPAPHPGWLGSFLADDSVCGRVAVSRSVAVTKYVMTPQGLLPLTTEEPCVHFSGPCVAQADAFHRVAYLIWLEQVRVLLLLLGRGATSPFCHTGSPATLANLPTRLQSKIMLSSYLVTRSTIMCMPSPLLSPLRVWSGWWPELKPLETVFCTELPWYFGSITSLQWAESQLLSSRCMSMPDTIWNSFFLSFFPPPPQPIPQLHGFLSFGFLRGAVSC